MSHHDSIQKHVPKVVAFDIAPKPLLKSGTSKDEISNVS